MVALAILASGGASAQSVNLTGPYHCVQDCRDGLVGGQAFITQNGGELNLVNGSGETSRAWPDWNAPASRIWVDDWNQSAVYSPDGLTLQFDDGAIWQRDLPPPPPPVTLRVPRRMPY
jgi:hypothetical protein